MSTRQRALLGARPKTTPEIHITNIENGDGSFTSVVDPSLLLCDEDSDCQWFEICQDDLIEIDGVLYLRWRPKISPLSATSAISSILLPVVCNADSIGVRVTGEVLLNTLFGIENDPSLVSQFCDWLFSSITERAKIIDWVCRVLTEECFGRAEFQRALCEWFIDTVLENAECKEFFLRYVKDNLFYNTEFISFICTIFETCLQDEVFKNLIQEIFIECSTDIEFINLICGILLDCLDNNQLKDRICELQLEFLNKPEYIDKVCEITLDCINQNRDVICEINQGCQQTAHWNQDSDPDPSGSSSGDFTQLVDDDSGFVTHFAINGTWVCYSPKPDICVPVIREGQSSDCPISFPLIYNNTRYDDIVELISVVQNLWDRPISYDEGSCEFCFPVICGQEPPASIQTFDLPAPIIRGGSSSDCGGGSFTVTDPNSQFAVDIMVTATNMGAVGGNPPCDCSISVCIDAGAAGSVPVCNCPISGPTGCGSFLSGGGGAINSSGSATIQFADLPAGTYNISIIENISFVSCTDDEGETYPCLPPCVNWSVGQPYKVN